MKATAAGTETDRLLVEPLKPSDAPEMVQVLADPDLYTFTGGKPPTLDVLRTRYRAQSAGSGQPDEEWLNWIIRLRAGRRAVGFVQATVVGDEAELAWVVGKSSQGQGFASEAAGAVVVLLRTGGITTVSAHIHRDHVASQAVARSIGLERTAEIDDEGEEVWRSAQ